MAQEPAIPARSIEPELFGSLGERPLISEGEARLFAGEEKFLRASERRRRAGLWRKAAPLLEGTLEPSERVLYVARGVQGLTVGMLIGLGWLAQLYHQVLLVFTEKRLVEIRLTYGGRSLSPRVCSFPWRNVRSTSLRFRKLKLLPVSGKKQVWSLPLRGDRRLLASLLPRLQERLRWESATTAASLPLLHCPSCGRVVAEKAGGCEGCGTLYRSRRLAAVLSLAFPGAGLLYAGHPVLAFFDFAGEAILYSVIALALSTSTGFAEAAGLLVVGALFFALTKIESVHVSHLLLSRTTPQRSDRAWRKGALGGAAISVLAIAAALLAAGRLVPVLDHDLDFSPPASTWKGTREPSQWETFAKDPDLRSQWSREDGWVVSVFGYTLGVGENLEAFRVATRQQTAAAASKVLQEVPTLPAPLEGFRRIREVKDSDGQSVHLHECFVFDRPGNDVHHLLLVSDPGSDEEAQGALQELLAAARWIEPAPSPPSDSPR